MDLNRPDRISRCTWKRNADNTPHTQHTEFFDRFKVMPDILNAIGQTPLVRLNSIPKSLGIKCEIFAKCEFLNPGGSVKDRIAYRMVIDAEAQGLLKPGYTIIEPTSGNTGIGLAMAAAAKGYRCIIVMPEKMSNEKVYALQSLGAEIVRTPTEAAWDNPESHIGVAQKLQKEIPNSIILDQYTNPGNPLAHYDQTGTEIWRQCEGKLDYFVAGAGTGGTISGIGRKLKEVSPSTIIVGADPEGSILASRNRKEVPGFYEVEGIGYDFLPTVLDYEVIDKWVKTNDHDSLNYARMLIRQEGLLCGGSSGSALSAAIEIGKTLPADKRIVILLPDGIRNYMTKFVSDYWMEVRGFLKQPEPTESNKWWWSQQLSLLQLENPQLYTKGMTYQEAVHILQNSGVQQLVVTDDQQHVKGIITLNRLMNHLISNTALPNDDAEKALLKQFTKTFISTTLGEVSRMLEKDNNVIVLNNDLTLVGIANQLNLYNYISSSYIAKENGNA